MDNVFDNVLFKTRNTTTEYIAFRYRKDLRFTNGINPRTFEYVGEFHTSESKARESIPSKDNNYVYGVERITKYV